MYRTDEVSATMTTGVNGESPREFPLEMPVLAALAKRVFDTVLAGSALVLFLPLLAVIAFGVWRSSRGPILYSQPRAGRGGKSFRFYKFRSMVTNSDEVLTSFLASNPVAKAQWGEFQKLEDDPRITRFGRFIRRSSLDELPQLWNVLKGDMSLVGPRPCMLDQQLLYGPYWGVYCAIRPGLTGLWQVSGRNRLTYRRRVELDVQYVKNWSLWLDLKILFRTVGVVLTGHGSQ